MSEHLVGLASEIPERTIKVVEVGGVEVGVLRVNGEFRAFENRCPHQFGPVCYGEVMGQMEVVLDEEKRVLCERFSEEQCNLVCPWHGWSFDAITGECISDRRIKLTRWDLVERDGSLYVRRQTRSPEPIQGR